MFSQIVDVVLYAYLDVLFPDSKLMFYTVCISIMYRQY